jgi:cytochrome c oxidase subunit 3
MAASTDVAHHDHEKPNHPYHLVDPSPWPFIGAFSALLFAVGMVSWMHAWTGWPVILGLGVLSILYTMFGWWRDVIKESRRGDHNETVNFGLRLGMALFITSEVLFFFAFFWAFFWGALYPPHLVPQAWPPAGIHPIPAFDIPFLNTLILLLSGTTVTWAHHCVREGDNRTAAQALWLTVLLGAIFTSFQVYEYFHAVHEGLTIKSGIFGSTFYMATGFHGFHVFVGTMFLLVCAFRAAALQFAPEKHVGLEAAAWYWHFVDVVWLFLFVSIYWWGGNLSWVTTTSW